MRRQGSNTEEIAARLDQLERVVIKKAVHLPHSARLILKLAMPDKSELSLMVSAIEVIDGVLPDYKEERVVKEVGVGTGNAKRLVSQTTVMQYRDKQHWTEAELRSEGYPLYLSESWFRQQLELHKSMAEIGRVHGYKISTLEKWRIAHGIESLKPRIKKGLKEEAQSAYKATIINQQALTLPEFATYYNVSIGTASQWMKEVRVKLGLEEKLKGGRQIGKAYAPNPPRKKKVKPKRNHRPRTGT